MHTLASSRNWNTLAASTLGVVAAFMVIAYLLGMQVPFVATDRAAIYALAATGFGMCVLNMGRTTQRMGWMHPINLAGIYVGVLIVLVLVAVAAGMPLPLLTDDRAVFLFLAFAGLGKWALGLYSRMYLRA